MDVLKSFVGSDGRIIHKGYMGIMAESSLCWDGVERFKAVGDVLLFERSADVGGACKVLESHNMTEARNALGDSYTPEEREIILAWARERLESGDPGKEDRGRALTAWKEHGAKEGTRYTAPRMEALMNFDSLGERYNLPQEARQEIKWCLLLLTMAAEEEGFTAGWRVREERKL